MEWKQIVVIKMEQSMIKNLISQIPKPKKKKKKWNW